MTTFGREFRLADLDGSNGFRISGAEANDAAGGSVASAGDVNGDGFADVIVGAINAGSNGAGASYVVFGRAAGFAADLDLSTLDGTNGFRISGEAAAHFAGRWVASAGDINGDGFDDLVVGANSADLNGFDSGASYVVFGRAGGFAANLSLSALDGTNGFRILGDTAGQQVGFPVASAGDINGDGFDDLVIGATGAHADGAAYVMFGRVGGFAASIGLSALIAGGNGFRVTGEAPSGLAGFSAALAGDVNGDGFADLIVGDPATSPNGPASGAAYVVFGHALGFGSQLNLATLDGSNGFKLSGEAASDHLGRSVATAGDINGDGFDDLIVGAHGADANGVDSGASYVVFGRARFTANLNMSALDGSNGFRLGGEATGDVSGFSVASAGDLNRDGFADLLVGAYQADANGVISGASYVVFGRAGGFAADLDLSTLDGSTGFRLSGETAADQFGVSVASAGDVNNDGFDDLIIGASRADTNGAASGAGYVIFGKATHGSAGNDVLDASGADDDLGGLGGNDIVRGNGGIDTLSGGDGNDQLSGGSANGTSLPEVPAATASMGAPASISCSEERATTAMCWARKPRESIASSTPMVRTRLPRRPAAASPSAPSRRSRT